MLTPNGSGLNKYNKLEVECEVMNVQLLNLCFHVIHSATHFSGTNNIVLHTINQLLLFKLTIRIYFLNLLTHVSKNCANKVQYTHGFCFWSSI